MASDEASDITCGVCTATIVRKNIKSHQCVQQWHGITIESESQIFYLTNERGECLARVICDGKEQIVLINKESLGQSYLKQIQIGNEVTKSINLSVDSDDDSVLCSTAVNKNIIDELLIEEVRKRPPIYDYTLPLSFRGRHKVAELWAEISNALKGHLSAEEAKKKWKSLKDTYSKLVADEKKLSGSARSQQKPPWKHFEAMSFLRSVSKHKPDMPKQEHNLLTSSLAIAIGIASRR
ncbi:uncharacterized protein LOC143894867 isoform X4 [Temnothorax americanus]|uniref:uncharacterized protein LOC143894867 isoform X4 n=1 Tax=Temnothorax americanus TaxID=1964332 RepID=UPI00406809F9